VSPQSKCAFYYYMRIELVVNALSSHLDSGSQISKDIAREFDLAFLPYHLFTDGMLWSTFDQLRFLP
jgi:hypothetical protein